MLFALLPVLCNICGSIRWANASCEVAIIMAVSEDSAAKLLRQVFQIVTVMVHSALILSSGPRPGDPCVTLEEPSATKLTEIQGMAHWDQD